MNGERGEETQFHALSSSAYLDEAITSFTAPGDELQLFYEEPPKPKPVHRSPVTVHQESAYEKRERLRDRRAALVADLSRLTGEPYAAIHARLNGATGAKSVSAATVDQLERANELLIGYLRKLSPNS